MVAGGGETTAANTLKSLLYVAQEDVVLAVVRGDHEINEIGLARHLGVDEVLLASDAAVKEATGTEIGFVGPVGFEGRIIADPDAVAPIRYMGAGDPCWSGDPAGLMSQEAGAVQWRDALWDVRVKGDTNTGTSLVIQTTVTNCHPYN